MNLDVGVTIFSKLKSLVPDDRVFPEMLDYEIDLKPDYIVYRVESPELSKSISGLISHAIITVSIDCFSSERGKVRALANNILTTLDESSDSANGVSRITYIGKESGYEEETQQWFETLSFELFKIN